MSQDGPDRSAPSDGQAYVVQHGVGRTRLAATVSIVAGLALVAVITMSVVTGTTVLGWLGGTILLIVWAVYGLLPWLAWHGLTVRIDDAGVQFGSDTGPARPPLPIGLARQRYAVPWASCADATVVEGQTAVATMRGFVGPQRPTTRNGFFVRKGAPAHLSLLVMDPSQTPLPKARVLRSGAFTMTGVETTYQPSRRWVFPLTDAEQVVAAFVARGIPISRTTEPAVPVPTDGWDG